MYTSVLPLFILLDLTESRSWHYVFPPEQINNKIEIFSWIGVLKVQYGNTEAVTGIILIASHTAIGNAYEVSKVDKTTLRRSSKAIFFKRNSPLSCNVTNYSIHPDFYNNSLNSIAILHLDSNQNDWSPINLPFYNTAQRNAYAIGLSDRRSKELEQLMFKMVLVNASKCMDFYETEELNYQYLWPRHVVCFRAADIKRNCIFDAGMALAIRHAGKWILIGMSILGPGCKLPSRYINIIPYMSWIESQIPDKILPGDFRRQNKPQMPKNNMTKKAIAPDTDIVSDVHDLQDDFHVDKLDDSTMAVRPGNANIREAVHGDCLNNAGIMMYREAGIVRLLSGRGRGVYALSLYDLFYYQITCVMVSVKCTQRSITKFWYERGFRKDDMSQFVKVVPHPKKERSGVPPKILFLTDRYDLYDNITTANLLFKFEFVHEATINVDFYGTLATTTTAPNATTPAARRTRRTYPRHLYGTWYVPSKHGI